MGRFCCRKASRRKTGTVLAFSGGKTAHEATGITLPDLPAAEPGPGLDLGPASLRGNGMEKLRAGPVA